MERLAPGDVLDPRDAAESAADARAGAVAIPADEVTVRTAELPPREVVIRVGQAGEASDSAGRVLAGLGRRFEIVPMPPASAPSGVRFRLWRPTAWLEEAERSPPSAGGAEPGRALDLACGSGRDAVWLAAEGWRVTAVDHLPDALAIGRGLEARYSVGGRPIEWRCDDVTAAAFDPGGGFDLICCFRFLWRPLFHRLAAWLRPGGRFCFETFTSEHRARFGRPRRDGLVLEPGELADLLRELEVLHVAEGWHGSAHTARALAARRAPAVR